MGQSRLLEEQVQPGLARAGSSWSLSSGGRQAWLLSCRETTSIHELAQLLISLEGAVRRAAQLEPALNRPRGCQALFLTSRAAVEC